jgi:hypothetical protein
MSIGQGNNWIPISLAFVFGPKHRARFQGQLSMLVSDTPPWEDMTCDILGDFHLLEDAVNLLLVFSLWPETYPNWEIGHSKCSCLEDWNIV